MRRVVIESPYAGDVEGNVKYLHDACIDCLRRGESPYASHGFFTHFLDDLKLDERRLGIEAGLAWGDVADAVVVYTDKGISGGMIYAIEKHEKEGRTIEYRSLGSSGLSIEAIINLGENGELVVAPIETNPEVLDNTVIKELAEIIERARNVSTYGELRDWIINAEDKLTKNADRIEKAKEQGKNGNT